MHSKFFQVLIFLYEKIKFQLYNYIIIIDEDDEELDESKESINKETKKPKLMDYFFHIFYFVWKLLFSIVPPSGIYFNY
jgi:hypothetical protein